jgi:hypothetical protein
MLRGLSQMRLSPDDAIFVQSLVRPLSERTLSAGCQVEEIDGDEVQYYIELDEPEEDGDGKAAGQGES